MHKTDLNSNEIIIFLAVCLNTGFVILSSNASKYSFTFIDCWKQLPLTATKLFWKPKNFKILPKEGTTRKWLYFFFNTETSSSIYFKILNKSIAYIIRNNHSFSLHHIHVYNLMSIGYKNCMPLLLLQKSDRQLLTGHSVLFR